MFLRKLCSRKGAVPEKNPYPPHGRSSEIPRAREVLKVKILEAKYEAKLEFPEGREGAKQKTFHVGEYGYFLEPHNYIIQRSSYAVAINQDKKSSLTFMDHKPILTDSIQNQKTC